ncbi:hypothetical protein [Flaviflexus massiliensis]|uniref:hypothetical protein n=1 Tax=Flaviflexus massiliensis TaxID=1522309 RepID=UPI0006D52B85|nr:hypothetical protein [Flaviflexus massiliensis]
MRTNSLKRSIVVAGLALALPFGLTACGGGKPSKEDVKDGMATILEDYGVSAETMEAAGISGEQLDGYYACIVDDVYDDVSDDTLNAIADGEDKMLAEDQSAFNTAVTNCQSELGL